MVAKKNYWGLGAAVIGLYMCLVFSGSIKYMLKKDEITEKLVDLEIVTIDDFTAQTKLNPEIFKKFMDERRAGF